MSKGKRTLVLVVLFIALLIPSGLLAWMGRDIPHLGYFQDDALYWITAKSLAEGHGYRILSLPERPFQTKYPPLYSFLISFLWKLDPVFPHNLRWAMLANWLMLPVYLLLARSLLAQMLFPRATVWMATAVIALCPAVVFISISILTDLLFSCLIFGALMLAERAIGSPRGRAWALAAGLVAAAAYLTRSAAIALVAAILIRFMYTRARSALLFLVAVLPGMLAWQVWVMKHSSKSGDLVMLYYTSYLGYYLKVVSLRDFPQLIVTNVAYLIRSAGSFVIFNPELSLAALVTFSIVTVAAVAGLRAEVKRKGLTAYHLFAAVYSLELIGFNAPPSERYLVPVFPLIAAGVCQACYEVFRRYRPAGWSWPMLRTAKSLVVAGLAGVLLIWIGSVNYGLREFLPGILDTARARLAEYRVAFQAAARDCPPPAPVIAYHDTLLYLYTGRVGFRLVVPSMGFYHSDPVALWKPFREVAEYAQTRGVACLFSTTSDYHTDAVVSDHAAMEEIFTRNPRLRLLFQSPNVRIYRIAPAPVSRAKLR